MSVNDNIRYIIIRPMAIQEHVGCDTLKVAPSPQHVTSTMLWIFPYRCGASVHALCLGQLGQ